MIAKAANTKFCQIFEDMIDNGEAAAMGWHTFGVYIIIKKYAHHSTGKAFPSHEELMKKTRSSLPHVKRAISKLVELGYVKRTKEGRHNVYVALESIDIRDESGRLSGLAICDYIPEQLTKFRGEVKDFLAGKDPAELQYVHIEIVHIDTVNIDKAEITMNINDAFTAQEVLEIATRTKLRRAVN